MKECCRTRGSNLRPSTYQADAHPIELPRKLFANSCFFHLTLTFFSSFVLFFLFSDSALKYSQISRKLHFFRSVIISFSSAVITWDDKDFLLNLVWFYSSEKQIRMDGWVRVLRPFNSISVISRRLKDEHERLCAMKRHLGSGRISLPAGFEPATPWTEVGSANRSATRTL